MDQPSVTPSRQIGRQPWVSLGWSFLTTALLAMVLWIITHGLQGVLKVLHATRQNSVVMRCGLFIPVITVILVMVLWKVPAWQVADPGLGAKDRITLENEARRTLAQILSGVGGVVILLGLYFTWRTIKATEKNLQITQETATKNLEIARETLRTSQEGQITERFTRAIDQLGSEKMEIRLGAIYALERIARDSEKDHWPIMEILTAYLRAHARWREEARSQPTGPPADDEEAHKPRSVESILNDLGSRRRIGEHEGPPTDIQAILTVLGRRIWTRESEDQRLNLSGLDLRGALLVDAHLDAAILVRTHLEEATLMGVHLKGGNLREAHLEGAQLIGVHCERANFAASWFDGALPNIEAASLDEVYMHGANLAKARLRMVDLSSVCGLTRTQIKTAITDEMTVLPDYLDE